MAAFFLDTSAVVKRYVSETGSAWVSSLTQPTSGNHLYLASITGVEVVSAIVRRQRGGSIAAPNATLMLAAFRNEYLNDYRLVGPSPALLNHAMDLAQTYALRGYDAVQLATALEVQRIVTGAGATGLSLISADTELNAAAAAEGLTVDDPNAHP